MKTKEDLRKHLEKDIEVLERYLEGVHIREDAGNKLSVVFKLGDICEQVISFAHKTFPPEGNLCLCWSTDKKGCKVPMIVKFQ
jgi:hypothetical protein